MKITLLLVAFSGMALAQTDNPFLPDAPLVSYIGVGNQNYAQLWYTWNSRQGTGPIGGSALCQIRGTQGTPASYPGFIVGDFVQYRPSSTLPYVCGPLNVNGAAGEQSFNPGGYIDHLWQGLDVDPTGSLPVDPNTGQTKQHARISQFEACSLRGDPPAYALGAQHTVVYNAGLCLYTGKSGGTTM